MDPMHLTERGLRMPKERERRLTNQVVSDTVLMYDAAGKEESSKGKDTIFMSVLLLGRGISKIRMLQ